MVLGCAVLFSLREAACLGTAVNYLGLLTVLLRRRRGFNMKSVFLIHHGMLLVFVFFLNEKRIHLYKCIILHVFCSPRFPDCLRPHLND